MEDTTTVYFVQIIQNEQHYAMFKEKWKDSWPVKYNKFKYALL